MWDDTSKIFGFHKNISIFVMILKLFSKMAGKKSKNTLNLINNEKNCN
jgi:hypothetical protein